MKKISVLLLSVMFVFSTQILNAQTFDDIYYKYKKGDNTIGFKVGGFLLSIISYAMDDDDVEGKEMIQKTKNIKMLVGEEGYNKSLIRDMDNYLKNSSLDEMITIKGENSENVRIYAKQSKKAITELVIMVADKDEGDYVIMQMNGNYPIKMVAKWIENEGFTNIASAK